LKKSLKKLSASLAALLIGVSTCPSIGAMQPEEVKTESINEKMPIPNKLLLEFTPEQIRMLFESVREELMNPNLKQKYSYIENNCKYHIRNGAGEYADLLEDFRLISRLHDDFILKNSKAVCKFFDIYVNKILIPVCNCDCQRMAVGIERFIEKNSLLVIVEESMNLFSCVTSLNIHSGPIYDSLMNILRGLKTYFESTKADSQLKQEILSKIRKTKITI